MHDHHMTIALACFVIVTNACPQSSSLYFDGKPLIASDLKRSCLILQPLYTVQISTTFAVINIIK